MSTEGWIFMVGFRVLDVGLLVVWLVWFFRLRDDDDSDGGGGGPGGGGPQPGPRRGPGRGGAPRSGGRALAPAAEAAWRCLSDAGARRIAVCVTIRSHAATCHAAA